MHTMPLCSPSIEEDYISRERIYELLSPRFKELNLLRQHAGGLHARLINAAWFRKIALETHCPNCLGSVHDKSCISPSSSHMKKKEFKRMKISVLSLKDLTLEEFQLKANQVGPATLRDFKLLSDSLRMSL